MWGRAFLFPVDRSRCSLLSAGVSQVFPPSDPLKLVTTKIYLYPWERKIVAPRRIPLILSRLV